MYPLREMGTDAFDHAIGRRRCHPCMKRKAHEACTGFVRNPHTAACACIAQTSGRGVERNVVENGGDVVRVELADETIASSLVAQHEIIKMAVMAAV